MDYYENIKKKIILGNNNKCTIMRKLSLLLFMLWLVGQLHAQTNVNGTVTNPSGEPVPGVTVVVKNFTNAGTITDENGKYTITVPNEGKELVFSFVGMKTKVVAINGRSQIDVQLQFADIAMDEVVVTALGVTRDKKSLGYAVQDLKAEDLAQSGKNDVVSSLQGQVAGVNITSAGGAGASTRIVIRGANSLDPNADNQPLFVVDGVPISNQTIAGDIMPSSGSNASSSAEQFAFSNRAMDINPDDIASISVLKGAAATALYGSRAANGAIIITTKSGQAGQTTVTFSSKMRFDKVTHFPEMQKTWGRGTVTAAELDSTPIPPDPNSTSATFWEWGYKRADIGEPFIDNMRNFFETGTLYENTVSISGGSDVGTFYLSASNLNQKGIVPHTTWGRNSVKLSASREISKHLKTTASVNYANTGGQRGNQGDKSYMSSLLYWSNSVDMSNYKDQNGAMISHPWIDNPYYLLEKVKYNDDVNRITGFIALDYTVNDNISFTYRLGNDSYSDSRSYIVPYAEVPGEQPLDVSSKVHGFRVDERISFRELNSDFMANFDYNLMDNLNMHFMLGQNIMAQSYDRLNSRGEGWASPGFYDISNTTYKFVYNSAYQKRMVGFYGDLRLGYNDYLYLDITGRNDISSTLPKSSRSYFYPSVNLGFIFSDAFGLESDAFSYGKLRASWAKVAKDAPVHRLDKVYTAYTFGNTPALTKDNSLGNSELKPEMTTSVEAGAELRFFKNRLGFDFSYYKANTVDMLFPIPVAYSTGYSSILDNLGELENKGVELLVNAAPVKAKNFIWNITVNYTKSKTKVISLSNDLDEIITSSGFGGVFTKLVPGGYYGDMYGYTWLSDTAANGTIKPIINSDGRPSINQNNPVYVGNVNPDWQMGITNTFNYKGFNLSFLIDIKQGQVMANDHVRNLIRQGKYISTENRPSLSEGGIVLDGVMDDGTGNYVPNTQPIQNYRYYYRYRLPSNVFDIVDDASWVRLRSLNISYDFRHLLKNNKFIKGVNLGFVATNLWLKTKYRGFDPDMSKYGAASNAQGYSGYSTPTTSSYGFNLNLKF